MEVLHDLNEVAEASQNLHKKEGTGIAGSNRECKGIAGSNRECKGIAGSNREGNLT